MRFLNRSEAGQVLARALERFKNAPDTLVLALPRGGVPVAYEVACMLNLPLDVFIVRKLGVPGHEELAMGAIASGGVRALNDSIIRDLQIPESTIDRVAASEEEELRRREYAYRGEKPAPEITGRTIILVDDGLATGSTMKAAVAALRQQGPEAIVVAVPLAPVETCEELKLKADEVICPSTPEPFYSVGLWYEDFEQTSDKEVTDLIQKAA